MALAAEMRYLPSPLEQAWIASNDTSESAWCMMGLRQLHQADVHKWLRSVGDGLSHRAIAHEHWPSRLLLRKRHMGESESCIEPIEPLSGTLRHPHSFQAICQCGNSGGGLRGGRCPYGAKPTHLLNASFHILASHCSHQSG